MYTVTVQAGFARPPRARSGPHRPQGDDSQPHPDREGEGEAREMMAVALAPEQARHRHQREPPISEAENGPDDDEDQDFHAGFSIGRTVTVYIYPRIVGSPQ